MYLLLYLNVINPEVVTAELHYATRSVSCCEHAGLVMMFSWSLVGVSEINEWMWNLKQL